MWWCKVFAVLALLTVLGANVSRVDCAASICFAFHYCGILFLFHAKAQSYEDKRCKCICPSLSSVLNNTNEKDRMMIIENVPPNKW